MQETYYNLSVDVEQNTSLVNCLKNYIGKEQLRSKDKFYCEKCNCLQEAEKQVKLVTLPKILIIQLKRFKMTMYGQLEKLCGLVNVPSEINLDFLLKEKLPEKSYNYYLRNIVIHDGPKIGYGHYFTLVRYSNNKWIIYNDEKVEYLRYSLDFFFGNPDENYRSNQSHCCYLLIYEEI
jgi:ubiquitin C-terminal hydrolase